MIRVFAQGTNIPTPGGKVIEEFIGNASNQIDKFSVAHMLMPVGWSEPSHGTEYEELVIVVKGVLTLTSSEKIFLVPAGQVCRVEPISDIKFSNTGTEICEYWAVCVPAFRLDRVKPKDS